MIVMLIKMKKNYTTGLIIFLLVPFFYSAQPTLDWANQIKGPAFGNPVAIASSEGGIFVTVTFSGTVDFDPGKASNARNASGNSDIFLTRYDQDGSFAWTKTFGGTGVDEGRAVCCGNERVVFCAMFQDVILSGPDGTGPIIGSPGFNGVFINSMKQNGDLGWSRFLLSQDIISCNNVKTATDGGIYLTGSFKGEVDFDPGDGIYNLTATGRMRDLFILKLDQNGNFRWAASFAVCGNETGQSLVVDKSGAVYVSGSFYSMDEVDFDPCSGVISVSPVENEDVFILKLDADGKFNWVKHLPGTFYTSRTTLALDDDNGLYLGGSFEGNVDVDPGPAKLNLASQGGPDAFIACFQKSGVFKWAKKVGGDLVDESYAVTCTNGKVMLSGLFTGELKPDNSGAFSCSSTGNCDVFLTVFDKEGNFMCGASVGGTDEDRGCFPLTDQSGAVYLAGKFSDVTDLDPGPGTHLTNGAGEYYLARMNDCGLLSTSMKEAGASGGIMVYPNPVTDHLYVDLPNEGLEIRLINIAGQVIFKKSFSDHTEILDMRNIPEGIYFMSVLDNGRVVHSTKVIRE